MYCGENIEFFNKLLIIKCPIFNSTGDIGVYEMQANKLTEMLLGRSLNVSLCAASTYVASTRNTDETLDSFGICKQASFLLDSCPEQDESLSKKHFQI